MASLLKSSACFALRTKHEGKYLQTVYRKQDGSSRIEATAVAVAGNARTRFFVDASEEKDGLVHVRSCYNNKYWVAVKDSGSSRWVIGTGDEPVEDMSSPSCTLFAPIASTDLGRPCIRFRHPAVEKYASVSSTDDVAKPYLQLEDDEGNTGSVFDVLGLSQQKELPKYIAFKQDDGNYLGMKSLKEVIREDRPEWQHIASIVGRTVSMPIPFGPDPYGEKYFSAGDAEVLVFHTKDKGHEGVICTVFTNDDGTVRIKSNKGGFWRRDAQDNIVTHDGDISDGDADTLFKVIHGDGFIALRNLGNNKICKIMRNEYFYEYLKAEEVSLSQYTQLKYDEPVHSRKIYDMKFHLDEARIYNTEIRKWVGDIRTNHGDTVLTCKFSFTQKSEKVTKWKFSVSESTGIESEITIGTGKEAPIMVSGKVVLSKQDTSSHGKEGSTTESQEIKLEQETTVAAGETKVAQLVAKRSSSDVPYSCKQRILLTNGNEIESIHEDGIYTVENNYDFRIIVSNKPEEIKRMMAGK